MPCEKYIFNWDASEAFYEKLESLHDEYVYHLLLSGVAPLGTDLESIKMTKNPDVSLAYCQRVVGGLKNIGPHVEASLMEDKKVKLECIFTHINDKKAINYLYMIQNVMNWPQLEVFSCQIWYLGETGVNQIKQHWS
jgi:hypothetical protein